MHVSPENFFFWASGLAPESPIVNEGASTSGSSSSGSSGSSSGGNWLLDS